MITFHSNDFNVSTTKQRDDLRNRLEYLGKSLIIYAKQSSQKPNWDYYVTQKLDKRSQWGAVCPTAIREGLKDQVTQTPNVYFNIPQNGGNTWVSIEIQFKQQRDFINSSFNKSTTNLLSKIQTASEAKIRVFEKVVLKKDKRNYKWFPNNLWNSILLPEIDVSTCNSQYLTHVINSLYQTKASNNPDWVYEPVLVIKYEFQPHEIINSTNVEQLIGDKVRILAPIVEFIIS